MDYIYILLELFKYIISKILDMMSEIVYSDIDAVDEVDEESIAEAGAVGIGDL